MRQVEVPCSHCGAVFIRSAQQVNQSKKRNNNQYCSPGCQTAKKTKIATPRVCLHCSQEFTRKKISSHDKLLYCSRRCGAAIARNQRSATSKYAERTTCKCGERKHATAIQCVKCVVQAKRDLTLEEYGEGYPSFRANAKIRSLARARYQGDLVCKACGYSLHVEICHIRPVSDFPKTATLDEVNHPDNLIALDPRCHWELDNGYLDIATLLD